MIRILASIAACCGWVTTANAEAARVSSGEHDGFTRLVIEYGAPVDWQFGRSADGYLVHLKEPPTPYDLKQAFDKIGKSRLAAIWSSPETGDLHFSLSCACHAIPFEFRPGIIVVDLKDGPPPAGSSFELALDGSAQAPIPSPEQPRPRLRPPAQTTAAPGTPQGAPVATYDWTATVLAELDAPREQPSETPQAMPSDSPLVADLALQPLRDSLLEEMARGASQGVIDLNEPKAADGPADHQDFGSAQIRIGDAPASVNLPDSSVLSDLGATGTTCLPAESLSVANWGDPNIPVLDQLSATRAGLSGEFDKPHAEAVENHVRYLIYLGFGAEARQVSEAFDYVEKDAPVLRALGHILDGEPDPEGVFSGQAACDGPAALWAFLSDAALQPGDPRNTPAIRLEFSNLPIHLRLLIGPTIATKLLDLGDAESARAIHDAIARASDQPENATTLLSAELDLHNNEAAGAEAKAEAVLKDPGAQRPEALVALVEARARQNLPIESALVENLQALLQDAEGSDLYPAMQDALVLAQAASGDFAAAFVGLEGRPQKAPEVWGLLATLAEDETFLRHAVLAPGTNPPKLLPEVAQAIARRLTGLGLADPAQAWLASVVKPDSLLLAETALKQGDAQAALVALSEEQGELTDAFRLRAHEILGQEQERAKLLIGAGATAEASRALARDRQWQLLAKTGEEPWKDLAARLPETATAAPGGQEQASLAKAHEILQQGEKTREEIGLLLAEVPFEPTALQVPQPSPPKETGP